MLQRLVASRLITPPAIWGKLAGHADFVRSHVRHGESDGWQAWLAQQGRPGGIGPEASLPASFVLPPGTLGFARSRFVVGVIVPSTDKVGRSHALLVYQLAHLRWLRQHFGRRGPRAHDWFFWLARVVARHASLGVDADIESLERSVYRVWQLHAPGLAQLLGRPASAAESDQRRLQRMQRVLDDLSGPAPAGDPAAQLQGVRHFPWADWPGCLYGPRGEGAFWQQDAQGGYVNAAARLPALWSEVE